MGRDVTGLRIDKKPSNMAKPNGVSLASVYAAPKIAVERDTSEGEDHTSNGVVVPDSHEKTDVLGVKRTNLNTGSPDVKSQKEESFKPSEKKLSSPIKPASGSTAVGILQTIGTVPESRSLANEKQNSSSSDALGAETVDSGTTCTGKTIDLESAVTRNKTESSAPASTKTVEPNDQKYLDDDDNLSLASSVATSVQTTRSKLTVPLAPTFKCVDRLARRKEYYLKLDEKHKALEVEKLEYVARTKEEDEAAIKQLRKSMAYKANPVPNFYREGPPPKVELKKLPVTRPKSPNLTRRKSCGDASKLAKSSPEEKGACARVKRHSFGFSREGSNSPTTTKIKDASGGRNIAARANREGRSTPNSTKSKHMLSRPKQNINGGNRIKDGPSGGNRIKDSPTQVKEASKTREISDISAAEEVTKVAELIARIPVIEETTETLAASNQMEADAAIVEEERKGSQREISETTVEI